MQNAVKDYEMLPHENAVIDSDLHFQALIASTDDAQPHKINPETRLFQIEHDTQNVLRTDSLCVGCV